MQKPNESLDDFVVRELEIQPEPPRPVSLRFTGEVEVLKPLARWVPPVKAEAIPEIAGLSWFHRSMVAGGAFVLFAVVLASAVFIGMYDGQPEVARVEPVEQAAEVESVKEFVSPDGNLLTEELSSDVFSTSNTSDADIHSTQRSYRSKRVSYAPLATRRSSNKRKPRQTQPAIEPFIPTTLIIYIDKGEVKSRIEPQLTAGYKKVPTLSN